MIPIWSFLILETDPTGPVGLHPSLGYFALPYISKWANPYRRPRRGITESALQFVGELSRPPRGRIANLPLSNVPPPFRGECGGLVECALGPAAKLLLPVVREF